ncbi:MAG: glycerophosphodiester phosphodiesterase family protein [Thermoguttaceae bacterium]|nr:glycerophosphodiester phosphodiesterase family protein [Thermoguttaceae bacterium]
MSELSRREILRSMAWLTVSGAVPSLSLQASHAVAAESPTSTESVPIKSAPEVSTRGKSSDPVWNVRDIPRERVNITAHRGAGFLAPENTMDALELSWSMGCVPEVDVRTTKDGHIMMFHDNNFARVLTNASDEMKKKRLEDLTYDEAKNLDIGSFRGPEFAGQKIVTLEEIVGALQKDSHRKIYIDVKNVDFAKMAEATQAVHDQVILATGKEKDIIAWRRVAPQSDTFLWIGTWNDKDDTNIEKRFASLRATKFQDIDRLQIHCHIAADGSMIPSDDFIRRAGVELRQYGIEFQTMPWNIPENFEIYGRLLDLGTEGFGTDRPDVAVTAVRAYYESAPNAERWNLRDHIPCEQVIVQGHRGAGDLAPEGSLEAFELAWRLGCVPEADLRLTKDGKIVSFHDNDFTRIIPDAPQEIKKKSVADLTFEECRQLDIGRFRGEQFAGQKMLSMAEMVELLKADTKRLLYIDIKKIDFAQLAAETVGVHPQLIVASTKYEELRAWKQAAPRSKTIHWMGGPQVDLQRRLDTLQTTDFADIDQLQIHVQTDSKGQFSPGDTFLRNTGTLLRRYGILYQTFPWGQKKPEIFHRLMDLGVASFASDAPDDAKEAVRSYYAQ